MASEDLYIILEIGRTASVNEIKRAFRRLARRYHPDINPGDRHAEDRFKRITEAYDILSDPAKRQFYDVNGFYTEGVLESNGSDAAWFSFQGFNFSDPAHADFGEFFSQVFRHRRERRGPERGEDLEYQISIGFYDSLRGRNASISLQRKQSCADCNGYGQDPGVREQTCAACGGGGKAIRAKGHLQFAVTCADCGG